MLTHFLYFLLILLSAVCMNIQECVPVRRCIHLRCCIVVPYSRKNYTVHTMHVKITYVVNKY